MAKKSPKKKKGVPAPASAAPPAKVRKTTGLSKAKVREAVAARSVTRAATRATRANPTDPATGFRTNLNPFGGIAAAKVRKKKKGRHG